MTAAKTAAMTAPTMAMAPPARIDNISKKVENKKRTMPKQTTHRGSTTKTAVSRNNNYGSSKTTINRQQTANRQAVPRFTQGCINHPWVYRRL